MRVTGWTTAPTKPGNLTGKEMPASDCSSFFTPAQQICPGLQRQRTGCPVCGGLHGTVDAAV